ncbi:50S ribosomal protein L23 [soil metagenome]
MTSKTTVLKPRMSEKTYALAQEKNVYVFEVSANSNKQIISEAVQSQFKVTVEGVKVMNVKGKPKRTVRRGGRATAGKRSDFKKAYVTLKPGDLIPVFASEEDKSDTAKKEVK